MRDYPLTPVPFTDVRFDDTFWTPRLETNRKVTLPFVLEKCRQTGRVDNFVKAAGNMPGPHEGREFNDTDVYKAIEGAAYSLQLRPDPALEAEVDRLVELIEAAQEEDGYLYTARTVDPERVNPDLEGSTRWSNLRWSHELYCLGHLYEAAVAYLQATGKRKLLDVSLRTAELIDSVFGPDGRHDVPGHQEVEIGLAKLYRTTGETRWLELAKFFLDGRGHHETRSLYDGYGLDGYSQDHLPVTEQREAVGHAVRAGYMYAAMADLAALAGAEAYLPVLDAIWNDVVSHKLYLTGGIGARREGEAFGEAFELPNLTAYNETCAAIANVMWNHRMFLLHGESKYVDVLERTLYNGLISGVALGGEEFFYPNPLASDGEYPFNLEGVATRSPWFTVSCCPGNVVRFLPSLPGYAYARRGDTVYVNLFVQGETSLELDSGRVTLQQRTDYPWEGTVDIGVHTDTPTPFTLALRIPGWARGEPVPSDLCRYLDDAPTDAAAVRLTVDGEPVAVPEGEGYVRLTRTWQGNEVVQLELPMRPRFVVSHPEVAENAGCVALERGPIVYCAEAVDHGGSLEGVALDPSEEPRAEHRPDLLAGITLLHSGTATLVPYYAWSHRGVGEMQVWLEPVEAVHRMVVS